MPSMLTIVFPLSQEHFLKLFNTQQKQNIQHAFVLLYSAAKQEKRKYYLYNICTCTINTDRHTHT